MQELSSWLMQCLIMHEENLVSYCFTDFFFSYCYLLPSTALISSTAILPFFPYCHSAPLTPCYRHFVIRSLLYFHFLPVYLSSIWSFYYSVFYHPVLSRIRVVFHTLLWSFEQNLDTISSKEKKKLLVFTRTDF